VSRLVLHMTAARRARICSWMSGDFGVAAVDAAEDVRHRNWGCSARCPRTLRPNSFCWFTWINGVDLRYGSTADQGRTGRKDSSSRLWRSARTLGTHAKQGPSTGHSVLGLPQAAKCLLTPRPHFTAPSCSLVTRSFVLRTALLFVRSVVRLVYAALPGADSDRPAEASTLRAGDRVLGWRCLNSDEF
jgi:hypothetical protein